MNWPSCSVKWLIRRTCNSACFYIFDSRMDLGWFERRWCAEFFCENWAFKSFLQAFGETAQFPIKIKFCSILIGIIPKQMGINNWRSILDPFFFEMLTNSRNRNDIHKNHQEMEIESLWLAYARYTLFPPVPSRAVKINPGPFTYQPTTKQRWHADCARTHFYPKALSACSYGPVPLRQRYKIY